MYKNLAKKKMGWTPNLNLLARFLPSTAPEKWMGWNNHPFANPFRIRSFFQPAKSRLQSAPVGFFNPFPKVRRVFFPKVSLYGCFQKWWYPTTMGFPTKNEYKEALKDTSTAQKVMTVATAHSCKNFWNTNFENEFNQLKWWRISSIASPIWIKVAGHHLQRFPSQMSSRTRRKASRSWTRPCRSRPAQTMAAKPCPHKNTQIKACCQDQALVACVVRHLRQVKSPFRFSERNIAFRNSRFQDRASTKSKLREAFPEMRKPSS